MDATTDPNDPLGILKPKASTQTHDPLRILVPKKDGGAGSPPQSNQPDSSSGSTPSINGLNSFQSTPKSTANSPVIDAHLKEQMKQKVLDDQKELSDRLKSNMAALNPQTRNALNKALPVIANRSQGIISPVSQDETDHYNFMQTPVGKTLGAVAYLGSKASHGTLDVLKGAAHLAELGTNPIGTIAGVDPTKDFFDKAGKATNFGLTGGDVQRIEGGKGGHALSALGMAAEFAPTVAGGEALDAPKAMMYLQGVGQGSDLANKLNISNPVAKEALIQGSGAVNLLLTDVFNGAKIPNSAKGIIVSNIAADALKEAGSRDIESGTFKSILEGKAQQFAKKFEQAPVEAMSHYLETAKTFTKLNVANFGLHKAVDALNDKPVFNETVGGLAGQEMKALTQDAPTFAALPTIGALSKLFPNSGYKNDVAESLMNDPSEENVGKLKQQLTEHAQQNEWTPEQTDATLKHVDAIADAAKSLPRTIAPDKRSDAVDLVMNRNDLQDRLRQVQAEKSKLDPSLSEIPNAKETYFTDKIEQANDKLRGLATDTRTTYSKGIGEEEGKFFKTTNGKREEITPSRYQLENTERSLKNQNNGKEESNAEEENGDKSSPEKADESRLDEEKNDVSHATNKANAFKDIRDAVKEKGELPSSKNLAKEANSKDWYHGSGKDLSKSNISSAEFSRPDGLLGLGFYTTDDPEIADSYAKKRGNNGFVNKINIKADRVLDAEQPISSDVAKVYKKSFTYLFDGDDKKASDFFDKVKEDNPNASMMDYHKAIRDYIVDNEIPTSEAHEAFQDLEIGLKDDAGYDAISHKGGINTGGKNHNVMILLDPSSEYSNKKEVITNKSLHTTENATNKESDEESSREEHQKGNEVGEISKTGGVDSIVGSEKGEQKDAITQKAIDSVVHGVVYSTDEKFDGYAPRFDFEMSKEEKDRAVRHIKDGNYDSVAAKKMLDKIKEWEKNDNYPIIEGTGGHTVRNRSATSDEIQRHIDDEKINKANEFTDDETKEFNNLFSDLGLTYEDFKAHRDYEQQQERNTASNSTSEANPNEEAVQQPENDGTRNDGNNRQGEGDKGSERGEEKETGIRNADVAKERDANIARESKSFKEVDAEGKRTVDSGEVDPNELASDIVSGKKKAVTAEEEAALLYHKTRLNNRQNAILDDNDPDNIAKNQAEYVKNEGLLEDNRKATEIAGNVAGRSLAYRRQLMKSDYSLATLLRRAKLFNGGVDIGEDVKAKLAERSKRISELEEQLSKREEQIRKMTDENTVSKVKRSAEFEERTAKRTTTKASLRKEREDIKAELMTLARKSRSNVGANKIPFEFLAPMAKLARNYVLDGAVSISAVADKIFQDVKDHIEDVSKEDIESAIKDHFDKYLSEKNAQRLEGAKKRQQNKLDEMKSGNYEKKVYSKIQVDNDYLHIRAEINKEQQRINKQFDDIQNSKKNIARKVTDFAVKYGRQAKLASVTVLGKLAAAGLTTVGIKPVTEAVGGGISRLLPSIAAKSAIEGGTDFSGMAKAYAKAATQGMKDAYDEMNIKAGGKSDLSALYGKSGQLPAEAAEFFGHIHSAIKAPVKRFAWEQSYSKRIAKGMAAGIDITDPVVDARNRLAAYKDAERAIFMGDNALSEAYEGLVGRFERADDSKSGLYLRKNSAAVARILLPFVKVPTNIALSSGRYAFGLIPGLGKLAQIGTAEVAKRVGAEKLAAVLGNGLDGMSAEDADLVLRNLKHGSIGGVALVLGFYNPKNIGGYYQSGEKRKAKDVGAGQFEIFGEKVPMWLTEHPIFQAMQIGATYRRLLDSHLKKDDKVETATLGTLSGISSNVPLAEGAKNIFDALGSSNKFNKFTSNTVKGEVEPAIIQQLAQVTDTKDGSMVTFRSDNQNKRKPNNKKGLGRYLKEDLETGIPVLRETVKK